MGKDSCVGCHQPFVRIDTGRGKAPRYCSKCAAPRARNGRWEKRRGFKKESSKGSTRDIGDLYGITEADWDSIYRAQRGICPVCQADLRHRFDPSRRMGKVAAIDHDHSPKFKGRKRESVRALLCAFPCNRLLWKFWTPAKLRAAADVLEHRPAQKVLGASG